MHTSHSLLDAVHARLCMQRKKRREVEGRLLVPRNEVPRNSNMFVHTKLIAFIKHYICHCNRLLVVFAFYSLSLLSRKENPASTKSRCQTVFITSNIKMWRIFSLLFSSFICRIRFNCVSNVFFDSAFPLNCLKFISCFSTTVVDYSLFSIPYSHFRFIKANNKRKMAKKVFWKPYISLIRQSRIKNIEKIKRKCEIRLNV